jgi:hypothetical protein
MPVISDRATRDVRAAYDSLEQFDQDNRYIDVHYDRLYALHKDQWVAVYKGEVIGVAPEINALLSEIERKGIDPGNVARRKLIKDPNLIV